MFRFTQHTGKAHWGITMKPIKIGKMVNGKEKYHAPEYGKLEPNDIILLHDDDCCKIYRVYDDGQGLRICFIRQRTL